MATSAGRSLLRRPWVSKIREQARAAVDEDRLAGDVGGVLRGEEARHAGCRCLCVADVAHRLAHSRAASSAPKWSGPTVAALASRRPWPAALSWRDASCAGHGSNVVASGG